MDMKRLELLDWGRFVAAIMVLVFHYAFNGIANGKVASITYIPVLADAAKYGYLGVELFFMISGYVIFYSAKSRSPAEFAVSRAVRLYPAYWMAVILTSIFASQLGGSSMSVGLLQVSANLTMLQSVLGVAHVDGVYWTLMLEISFYGLVFVLLILGARDYLDRLFIAWPFLMLLAYAAGIGAVPFLGGYYSYFAAGAIFAVLRIRFSPVALVALFGAFLLCLSFSVEHARHLTEAKQIPHSPVVVVTAVSAFFLLFFLQNMQAVQELSLPGSRLAGALTYPLYLVHAHLGYMLLNRFATEENKVMVYGSVFAFVMLMAYLIHRIVEQQWAVHWQRLFRASIGRLAVRMEAGVSDLRAFVLQKQGAGFKE